MYHNYNTDSFSKYTTKKNYIYYWYGSSLLLLNNLRSDLHKHYPAEIYLGLDSDFEINFGNGWNTCRSVVIDSNQQHQVNGGSGCLALFLVNPNPYNFTAIRNHIFADKNYYFPEHEIISSSIKKINRLKTVSLPWEDAKILANELVVHLLYADYFKEQIDPRISKLLLILEAMPEKSISIQKIAQHVNLSDSRLSHLFKESTGTTIRRYLLWLKLRMAIKLIMQGKSFTMAAHESGFSDSAHLSRTYKQMFGIAPSELLKSHKSIKILFSF